MISSAPFSPASLDMAPSSPQLSLLSADSGQEGRALAAAAPILAAGMMCAPTRLGMGLDKWVAAAAGVGIAAAAEALRPSQRLWRMRARQRRAARFLSRSNHCRHGRTKGYKAKREINPFQRH